MFKVILTVLLAGVLDTSAITSSLDTLNAASITSRMDIIITKSDTLKINPESTISDLLLKSPALIISDYGGAAGLKNINLRGLGTAHTAIYIDGFRVMNNQSGQSDLALIDLSAYDHAVVDYAQNSLSFLSAKPQFKNNRRYSVNGKLVVGAFNTYDGTEQFAYKFKSDLVLSARLSALYSKGDYPYSEDGIRENNDVKQIRGGANLNWHSKCGDIIEASSYLTKSERGTPGSITYPSSDRQNDEAFFVQGLYKKELNSKYKFSIGTKYSDDRLEYISSWGNSDYDEKTIQLNTAQALNIISCLKLSLVANYFYSDLKSSLYNASRNELLARLGGSLALSQLKSNITLEYRNTDSHSVFCPSADFKWQIIDNLSVTGFAKRDYRVPTFNELYYPSFGNDALSPEDAILSDLGINYTLSPIKNLKTDFQVDVFYNDLKEKIISAPTIEDPSIWKSYNLGKVKSYGVDLKAFIEYKAKDYGFSLLGNYSYQDSPDDIPYMAKHSSNISLNANYAGFEFSTAWNLRAGRKDAYGDMPDWNTLDLSLSKSFLKSTLLLKAYCRNLFNSRYELVSGYPAIGRNYGLCLVISM